MDKIIQITSGKGPEECEFLVGETFEILQKEMEQNQITFKVLEETAGKSSGFQSITLEVEDTKNFLEQWMGSILFIGKSKFRPHHKRKNWYIGIFQIEGIHEVNFREEDLEFQTMRSSGNGGQNVNKVNSAVRITHLPTKIQAVSMDSRSQMENKKIALKRLKLKILEENNKKTGQQKQNQWLNHLQLERGNPVKTFRMD